VDRKSSAEEERVLGVLRTAPAAAKFLIVLAAGAALVAVLVRDTAAAWVAVLGLVGAGALLLIYRSLPPDTRGKPPPDRPGRK
jgi:O-antigen/teichoic acid export membrane protein